MRIITGNIGEDKDQNNIADCIKPFHFDYNSILSKFQNNDIEKFYPKNSYYRIRRLVFQACEYWKNQDILKDDKKNIVVPFNNLYNLKNEKNSFREMLDHIEMLFPVKEPSKESSEEPSKKPSEVKKVYYQAAKILCMFHEESAKITDIKDNKKYKKYHQVARYFRNWSAHNKFGTLEMRHDIFALLLCITLRTYFDDAQNSNSFSVLYDYEKLYYGNIDMDAVKDKDLEFFFENLVDNLNNKYSDAIKKHITSQYKVSDITNKSQNIDSLIRTYGETNVKDIPMKFLLYGTVFDTVIDATTEYYMQIKDKKVDITKLDKINKWFKLNDSYISTNLKSYIIKNGTDFEKLIMLQAYEILKDSNNS